jgi:hypothetical protein
MTSIISSIQKHLHITSDSAAMITEDERHQSTLQLLTALATLLVRDNEVAAVAVVRRAPLELMTCASQSPEEAATVSQLPEEEATASQSPEEAATASQSPEEAATSDGTSGEILDGFLATSNPRDPKSSDTPTHLHVCEPQPKPIPVEDPVNYLCEKWYVPLCF